MILSETLRHRLAWIFPLVILLLPYALVLFVFTSFPASMDDGLRHFTFAREMRTDGIHGWGRHFFAGYFSAHDVDPWFGSHLLYIPFSFLHDPLIGIKLASFSFILLLTGVFLFAVRRYCRSPAEGALALLVFLWGGQSFSGRLFVGRPYLVAVSLFLLSYLAIVHRRFILLAALSTVAALLSHLFVFILFIAIAGSLWHVLFAGGERPIRIRHALLCIAASAGGTIVGIFLHPQRAEYISYLWNVFLRMPFQKSLGLGNELNSGLLEGDVSIFLLVAFALLLWILPLSGKTVRGAIARCPELLLTTFLSLAFFAAYMLWIRAVDYLWPLLSLLFLQLLFVQDDLREKLFTFLRSPVRKLRFLHMTWGFVLTISLLFSVSPIFLYVTFSDQKRDPAYYSAIMDVPSGSHILNLDWDVFPLLYLQRQDLRYARGMDPGFDYFHDPAAFRLLDRVSDRYDYKEDGIFGLIARWNSENFSIALQREAMIDIASWLAEIKTTFHPDFLAVRTELHPQLIESLNPLAGVFVFSESKNLVVYRVR